MARESFIYYWEAPADNGGGRITGYSIRRTQSKSRMMSRNDPTNCDSLAESGYRSSGAGWTVGPDVFSGGGVINGGTAGASHYNCYRWHIAACNAAGCGPEAITDPVFSRPRLDASCRRPYDHSADDGYEGACVSDKHLEGIDWCNRLEIHRQTNVPSTYSSSGYGDTRIQTRWWTIANASNTDPYKVLCHIENYLDRNSGISTEHRRHIHAEITERFNCSNIYRAKTVTDGKPYHSLYGFYDDTDRQCALNDNRSACGSLSVYDPDQRECQCVGYARHKSGRSYPVPTGTQECGCHIGGEQGHVTGGCQCAQGRVFLPELNRCGFYPERRELTPSAGSVRSDQPVTLNLKLSGGSSVPLRMRFDVYAGDSDTPLPGCAGVVANSPEGDCVLTDMPLGTHVLWAKYTPTAVRTNDFFSNIQNTPLAPATVTVRRDKRADCGNPNPRVNPLGGSWSDVNGGRCEIKIAGNFYHQQGEMVCGDTASPSCLNLYEDLSDAACPARGLLYRATGASPDLTCVCPLDGEPPTTRTGNACRTPSESRIMLEIKKASPDLAAVRAELGAANPNFQVADVPAVFLAARRGHAEMVSILITAGANASARVGNNTLADIISANGQSGQDTEKNASWWRALRTMRHFGDAAKAAADASDSVGDFDWQAARMQHLIVRYNDFSPTDADKLLMEVMGGYMRWRGASCAEANANHPVCAFSFSCPAGGAVHACDACAGSPYHSVTADSCVASCPSGQNVVGETLSPRALPGCACAAGGTWDAEGEQCVEDCGGEEAYAKVGGRCITRTGEVRLLKAEGMSKSEELRAICSDVFGGTAETGADVCSGIDANDTFCIMGSDGAFPCRGLFKHVRECNYLFDRPALNPFFCGAKCGVERAEGAYCCPSGAGC